MKLDCSSVNVCESSSGLSTTMSTFPAWPTESSPVEEKIQVYVKKQNFGVCTHPGGQHSLNVFHKIVLSGCTESSGAACVFPFRYKGQTYYQCTEVDDFYSWCSTCVDHTGDFVDTKWGYCQQACP